MTTPFLDTDIFLRHLLNDHPQHSPACFALIQAIEQGRLTAWTTDLVIAEVVFVLANERTYHLPRERIQDLLLPLIYLPGLKLPGKRLYQRTFELYVGLPISFTAAFHAALMENRQEPELYSYDTGFDQVEGIRRLEPSP